MIKGQLSTGFPRNKHLFSIQKHREALPAEITYEPALLVRISQWKAHKPTCSALATGKSSVKKGSKV